MSYMVFIGRDGDLAFLRDCYDDAKAQLIILYGRRRVGKTETLVRFSQDRSTLFFAAQTGTKAGRVMGVRNCFTCSKELCFTCMQVKSDSRTVETP